MKRIAGLVGTVLVAAGGVVALSRRVKRSAGDSGSFSGAPLRPAAYHPINALKPVAPDIWVVDGVPVHPAGLEIPIRMTVIRLLDGSLALHSPTQASDSLVKQIAELGPVRHLIAPNTVHWMFVGDWQRRLPGATTWAVRGLRDRAKVRKAGIRIDHELDGASQTPWSSEIEHELVQGLGFAEVAFFHRSSRTLVLADLVQNLEQDRLAPMTRIFARLTDGNDAMMPRHVRATVELGGSDAVQALRRLLRLNPQRVIFSHGAWFETDASVRLNRALAWVRPASDPSD